MNGITNAISFSLQDFKWSTFWDFLFKVGVVIVLFFVFAMIIKFSLKAIEKMLDKKQVTGVFHKFILSIIKVVAYVVLIITLLGAFNINTAPLLTALGTLGLAVGLALKDHMSNLASGILIAINKQFAIGDFVGCSQVMGTVEKVELFNTRMKTIDNKVIYIPNSHFTQNTVTNYTKEDIRRVDISIGVSYSAVVEQVKLALGNIIQSNEKVLKEPAFFVGLIEFGNSSVNFTVRAWVKTVDYWDVYFYINEQIKSEFEKQNIQIPYPQLDVHFDKTNLIDK
ncbi:MAG: mechanosensitive ion channel [Clostridia bacterium]|nr:mechanosensitive ion channel [Clostridia bacterium]